MISADLLWQGCGRIHWSLLLRVCVSLMCVGIYADLLAACSHIAEPWCVCGPQQAFPYHSRGVQLKLCRSRLCDFRSYSNWPPLAAKPKLWELVGVSPNEPACTSECSCDVNMADRWQCFVLFFPECGRGTYRACAEGRCCWPSVWCLSGDNWPAHRHTEAT